MMMVLLLHVLFPALAKNEMRRNISSHFFYCLVLKNILCIIFASVSIKVKVSLLNGLLMQHWAKDMDTSEKNEKYATKITGFLDLSRT